MAKRTRTPAAGDDGSTPATDYRHAEKRKNIPPAQIASEGHVPKAKRVKYAYSPHLDPILRFDPRGRADKVNEIVEKACARKTLTADEQEILRGFGEHWSQPWLEWAGKQEEQARGHLDVDPIALHIHERISSRAILTNALRQDAQRSLFADPEQSYSEAVQFYKHDVDWANRMILGDSLQVMSSLAHRENLAGKVQTIYFDPPYGIDFGSNFQPTLGQTDVIDGSDRDLTREPETIKAFRDTWHIGAHSYLSYVRSRVSAARALLTSSGSIFVQIGDAHLHRVRDILDEVFGAGNSIVVITVKKKSSTAVGQSVADYLLWYCKEKSKALMQRVPADRGAPDDSAKYTKYELPSGERRAAHLVSDELRSARPGSFLRDDYPIVSQHPSPTRSGSVRFEGVDLFPPRNGQWRYDPGTDMRRLYEAGRLRVGETTAFGVSYWGDESLSAIPNVWTDTHGESSPIYVVQTNRRIVERCILMTSRPGDLVLDPTCGSGTTALVAEKWGRRWITIDTSRISISLARQRLLTERFDAFKVRDPSQPQNPASGFKCKTVPNITLKSIAQNRALDPIIAKHAPILAERLSALNNSLRQVTGDALRRSLVKKLAIKVKVEGARQIADSDIRRWLLPGTQAELIDFGTVAQRAKWRAAIPPSNDWRDWEVPFDADAEWPEVLKKSLDDYRMAWRAKMDEVTHCIEENAEPEDLVTEPEKISGVTRVSGPFTVESVMPEELALNEDGVVDLTPSDEVDSTGPDPDAQNRSVYLKEMTDAIWRDGVLFLGNQKRMFGRVEPLYESHTLEGIHAEAAWEGEDDVTVAICFGPQYGPVTAYQVEELIRSTKRYAHLVVAGFSFDPEATAIIEQSQHPKLKIHMAHIRPDMNPGMRGLLKDTPNSQIFTVFGMPAVDVAKTKSGEWQVTLEGVDIYDPVENTVRSTKAEKVAAWFLDSDFDGRCFCICQAFFPDQDAWEKIAKSLGSAADPEAFAAFKGTTSLAFKKGKHGRIAVKVIDPRGNEVMTVRKLEG